MYTLWGDLVLILVATLVSGLFYCFLVDTIPRSGRVGERGGNGVEEPVKVEVGGK